MSTWWEHEDVVNDLDAFRRVSLLVANMISAKLMQLT